jgi:hypothetical protein
MTELARKTFRLPTRGVLVLALVLLSPVVAADLYAFVTYPALLEPPFFQLLLLWFAFLSLFVVFVWLLRIPVVVENRGIRFAWLFRMRWEDVTDATIRKSLGFTMLIVARRRARPWQPWLYMYGGLPEFLATHAPEGNPLRKIRDLTGAAESR